MRAGGREDGVLSSVDLEKLLKLRVVVARIGEMDRAQWWNTRGQLGPYGAAALSRGLPRTHWFAQARSVFAVAAHRCSEIYDPPESINLWRLPGGIEEPFDARWEAWLDNAPDWTGFFEQVGAFERTDVPEALRHFGLTTPGAEQRFEGLRTSAEGRAVAVPASFAGSDEDIAVLALGFGRGSKGALAVPFARASAG